jgi:hypothetical protein
MLNVSKIRRDDFEEEDDFDTFLKYKKTLPQTLVTGTRRRSSIYTIQKEEKI